MMISLGVQLGLTLFQAASGIIEIATAHMMGAMRLVSVQRDL
jgi:hypothetical protein